MTENPTYVYYPVFGSHASFVREGPTADTVVEEAERLFEKWNDRVEVRGTYSTVGFGPPAGFMMWWISQSAEDIQGLVTDLRRSTIAKVIHQGSPYFMGVHRPPETAPDHLPAFMRGERPRRYLCVYPFVRTPEWYLLPKQERADLLAEHGVMGRQFPGVLPNTTSAFGLGDHEWILAFEADDLVELVDCIRRLRDSGSRLYVKHETPFVTGIRKDLAEVIRDVL
jgi:hydrogen peroxide-dependent heme synthase